MNETNIEKFREVLNKFDTAILATVDDSGKIHARPMAIFEIESDGNVIFITDENSAKVDEIERNQRATVIYQDGWTCTATITGSAEIFRDSAKLRENWRKTFQAWFPDGPDDPRILLLRVRGEVGEFWDNSGLKAFRYMYQAAKAVLTGGRPKMDPKDQHAKVVLK
jgi:general stress protein 26